MVEEKKPHLPNPREGEHVFGVAHIFASFNDTFVVSVVSGPAPSSLTGKTLKIYHRARKSVANTVIREDPS